MMIHTSKSLQAKSLQARLYNTKQVDVLPSKNEALCVS